MFLRPLFSWIKLKWKFLTGGIFVGVILVVGVVFRNQLVTFFASKQAAKKEVENVIVPTIINGELMLPKVASLGKTVGPSLNKATTRLGVVSANLVPIVDTQQGGGQTLSGIRILGETENLGDQIVSGLSPVIRFFDSNGTVIGQKVARLSTGWDFFGILPNERSLYDVTVDGPPTAEKLEIVLNVSAATDSAVFELLKIASRSVEVKTATYQGTNDTQATGAASQGQKVEYYSVLGAVVNTFSDPVSDISVYAWIKDKGNKVYSFARQDFKNDLLVAGGKIDFKMTLLPLKDGESFDSYEVAAWGKRYKLNL